MVYSSNRRVHRYMPCSQEVAGRVPHSLEKLLTTGVSDLPSPFLPGQNCTLLVRCYAIATVIRGHQYLDSLGLNVAEAASLSKHRSLSVAHLLRVSKASSQQQRTRCWQSCNSLLSRPQVRHSEQSMVVGRSFPGNHVVVIHVRLDWHDEARSQWHIL